MKLIIRLRVLLTTSFTFKFFPLFHRFFSHDITIYHFYFSLLRKGSIEKQEELKHQTVQN